MNHKLLIALAMTVSQPDLATSLAAAPAVQTVDDRPDISITKADRDLAITNLVTTIREQHFSVTEGERIASEIEQRWQSGRYGAIDSGRTFAMTLTDELRAISDDQHFRVDYFFVERPYPMPAESDDLANRSLEYALNNYGIRTAERLEGNIGYLRIDRFAPAQSGGPVLIGAMAMLATTDALIIDLRYNRGGYGDMTALLVAQFLREPVHLGDVIARDGVMQKWTPLALNDRYLDKPVYVLTSGRTFSAAEGFAYDMQALGRAKIVGEQSRGGANPAARVQLSSRFWMIVPVAQVVSSTTGGNWQGRGVTPDIAVPANQALASAQRDAASILIADHQDDPITDELRGLIEPK